ncbi:outer membrane lipoprotein carrier protein LolA [uncultured Muribaculum sp.]|uniref:LolA family protein n=1 Tax=uncultured Muribaculum sp. TaxID=1918613 RepID=UPI00272A6235|nr:outer membrane lipoprotein carrier protein LolA [uncultured Muribaculum sp.]
MRKTMLILLFSLFCQLVSAAGLTAPRKQEIIGSINSVASAMKSMTCSFTQTKYLSLLSDKMVSEGKMYYRQPNRLRWEYTSPYQYLFVLNGTKVYVGNKSRKDVIDTDANKVFKEIARIMMGTVTGTVLSGSSDFSVDVADGGTVWRVTLVPSKKEMKRMFSKIVLSFRKNGLMVSEIDIYEKNNDRTNIQLKNVKTNISVNDALFAIPK